ncbi:MAG: alkaline phosphatase PhoX [Pseudomonadota bacterium]
MPDSAGIGEPPTPPGTPPSTPVATPRFANLGPLRAADANGVRTPEGFSTRVVAINNELPQPNGMDVAGPSSPTTAVGTRPWHILNDGGAVIARPNGGWIYVSNSEVPGSGNLSQAGVEASTLGNLLEELTPGLGGVGTLVFDPDGTIVDSYSILTGTTFNCAGVITPWNTWLSCEEFANGQVWECDPFAAGSEGVALPALGFFDHEAITIDAPNKILYLTEDSPESRFYRFIPSATDWPAGAARPALQAGRLQTMVVGGLGTVGALDAPQPVTWVDTLAVGSPQLENRDPATAAFDGGEGVWLHNGIVYFSTKGDETIWAYDTIDQTLEVIYRHDAALGADAPNNILSGVDNLIVTPQGDVLVAEDGGDLQVVVILPDGTQKALLQVTGQDASEVAGISFTPDGKRMYFTSDRGGRGAGGYGNGAGMLYELMLPDTI